MRRDKAVFTRTYEDDHSRYKQVASARGLSLSEWARRAMSSQADLDELELREKQEEEERRQFYANLTSR